MLHAVRVSHAHDAYENTMDTQRTTFQEAVPHWSAVFSLFMGVTSLIAAEFIPVSLLTPIARDLAITEGMAGQAVTAVGACSVLSSLLVSPLARTVDRRHILLGFSLLLVLSNLLVAAAPNFAVLLAGRCLLGICVGGFWSLVPAVTLQLVPSRDLPRALSIVYAGVSVATIVSLPLSSYLGHLIGWRNVFVLASAMGGIMFVWQWRAMPALPARTGSSFRSMLALMRERWVVAGMGGIIFSYGGYHVFFTYLRPFLEHHLALQADTLAGMLLSFGIANCLGTFAAGYALSRWFRMTLPTVFPAFILVAILLLVSKGTLLHMMLVLVWGFLFGFIPVGWSAWIARTLADKAELAGGVSVAVTQFSMGLVAAVGGLTFDTVGIRGNMIIAVLFFAAAFIMVRVCFSLYTAATGRRP